MGATKVSFKRFLLAVIWKTAQEEGLGEVQKEIPGQSLMIGGRRTITAAIA